MGLRNRELKTPEERWNDALDQLSDSTAYQYKHELEEFLVWAEDEAYDGLIGIGLKLSTIYSHSISIENIRNLLQSLCVGLV